MCARAQIARQQAIERLAVPMYVQTSECEINMPQLQPQVRLYKSLAVELDYEELWK